MKKLTTVNIKHSQIKVDIDKLNNNTFEIIVYNKKTHSIISSTRYWLSKIDTEYYYNNLKKAQYNSKSVEGKN